MDSNIRDNTLQRGTVGEFLNSKIADNSKLSIVSAYFTIYAYHALKDKLNAIDSLRFLFGSPNFLLDSELSNAKAFSITEDTLCLNNRLEQKQIAKECAEWISKKVEIRSVIKNNLIHGKMYHIANQYLAPDAIMGSSNMTASGLGFAPNSNIELNLELQDKRDVSDILNWFNALWDNSKIVQDVKADVLDYLAKIYSNSSPEFIYYLTLYNIFKDLLPDSEEEHSIEAKSGFYETKIWNMLYPFQKDGVKGAIDKIKKHGGCIIADSVGLGKTFEALAVIKYFEKRNNNVLVLCPKRLGDNWMVWKNNETRNVLFSDQFRYDVFYHTDLTRKSGSTNQKNISNVNWGNYDLVVIDESHNFKNSKEQVTRKDRKSEYSRYGKLLNEVLLKGIDTKVLLLSATPVNSSLKDLRNQIHLISKKKDELDSGVGHISNILKNAQIHFANWAKQRTAGKQTVADLLNSLDSSFYKLLDDITIARSRKHIVANYNSADVGTFPERLPVQTRNPILDINRKFPSFDKMKDELEKIKLHVYNPSEYVKNEFKEVYNIKSGNNFDDQGAREYFLVYMMRVSILKRLESSVDSYRVTLKNILKKLDETLSKIDEFKRGINLTAIVEENILTSDSEDEEQRDDLDDGEAELFQSFEVGVKLKYKLAHLDVDKWKSAIEQDRDSIIGLLNNANAINPEDDGKLQSLKDDIVYKFKNPINKGNKKVLIFTAFSDTANYLYDNLKGWVKEVLGVDIACVSGGANHNNTTFVPTGYAGQTSFDSILTNFSPISKSRSAMNDMPQDGEIDVLIATDCISEGQNLQDCDCVINYDIHWNPIKIIQRFGRIDRLNSKNSKIQLVNYWPTADLNKYIRLKERVETRMALADLTATGDDNLLESQQLRTLLGDDLTYRDKQLLRLKDEIVDLEDMEDSINLSDFTLDEFRADLISYIEQNKQILETSPNGLYSIVSEPAESESEQRTFKEFESPFVDIAKAGVIFCLKQVRDEQLKDKINPLQPYFLVYIRNDGTVRYNFINSKNILLMMKHLCKGKKADEQLCKFFDKQTNDGKDMSAYNDLLFKALSEISSSFNKRSLGSVMSSRDATISSTKAKPGIQNNSFELITWLIILNK